MRANLGYPPGQSYAEMGKTKPTKEGRNTKLPRPFRDVNTMQITTNRSERRSELISKGGNAIGSRRMFVTAETVKNPIEKVVIMPVVKKVTVKYNNIHCHNEKCNKVIKPNETAIKVRVKGGRAEYYCSDKCYQGVK